MLAVLDGVSTSSLLFQPNTLLLDSSIADLAILLVFLRQPQTDATWGSLVIEGETKGCLSSVVYLKTIIMHDSGILCLICMSKMKNDVCMYVCMHVYILKIKIKQNLEPCD